MAGRTKARVVSDFRRMQILEAARQNFIRHGVADTTVDGIARSARVAKGTVYLYYKSKDEILRQLLAVDLAELERDTVAAIAGAGLVDERLRRFFHATLAFFDCKRDFIDHCQLEMSADVRKKARQKLGLVYAAQVEAWRVALRDARQDRRVRTPDLAGTARAIVSLAHGLAIHRLRGWHSGSLEDAVALATSLVLNGVEGR